MLVCKQPIRRSERKEREASSECGTVDAETTEEVPSQLLSLLCASGLLALVLELDNLTLARCFE